MVLQYTEFIYSMKRKSANQIAYPEQVRSLKRNNSCMLNKMNFNRFPKDKRKNTTKQFVSVTAIVDLLINEWLDSLDHHLQESDQKQFHQAMIEDIDVAVTALFGMLNPVPLEEQAGKQGNAAEQQPVPVAGDLFCGGNSIAYDTRTAKIPRISISIGLQEHKRQKSQIAYSKSNISSKCLIKLPKEQLLQRRQGLEALKQGQPEKRDVFEEILRDKFMKEKKNIYFNQQKLEATIKQNTLPSIQEYSFDYDGTVFPLKKNSIQTSHRIKVLNTTCRVLNRDYIQHRKQSVVAKLQGPHMRTQAEEIEKENKRYGEKRDLSQRKPSKTDSVRELLRICTESDELTFKARIEESVGSKSVKLRQLKAHH